MVFTCGFILINLFLISRSYGAVDNEKAVSKRYEKWK